MRAQLDEQILQSKSDAIEGADWADRANQQTEVAVNIGLVAHEAAERKEFDDALIRIAAGTFGVCEKCRGAIGTHRLNAVPFARYCVRCERRVEQEGSH